jgi:hypothetical protein
VPFPVNITLNIAHNFAWQNANFWREANGRRAIIARFWSQVNRRKAKGAECWLWVGNLDPEGYGCFKTYGAHCIRAHKFSWSLCRPELQLGRTLRHTCGNRRCVNPTHLRIALVHPSTGSPVHTAGQ